MRRRHLISLVLIVLAGALPGCGGNSGSSSSSSASSGASTTTASSAAAQTAGCHSVAAPSPKGPQHLSAPAVKLDPAKTYTVTVLTNCGTFAFTLDVKQSPKTSASFYSLVKRSFFDGLTFHRVAAGFVIQGGDPNGDGSGGPGYTVAEPPPHGTQYVKGDVAMAKTQSDPSGASGSQFFVVTAPNVSQSAGLTPDYALLGKVISGQNVVDAIGALPTNPPQDGTPTPTVVMARVSVAAS